MDNYIFLVVFFELLLASQVNVWILILLCLGYAWWYFDGKEYTGEGRSDGLRGLSFWKRLSPVNVIVQNELTKQTRHLYLFSPCSTITSLFWSIGLHGTDESMFVPRHAINYLVPPIYMWIPFFREFLKWTGAVTWSKSRPHFEQNAIIRQLLQDGRSVAYSPSNFVPNFDPEHAESNYMPSDDVLTFCLEQHIKIVIVNVKHETKRYSLFKWNTVQNWIYEKTGHFFPVLFWKRFGPQSPLIEVEFQLGFESEKYDSLSSLKFALNKELQTNYKTK